MSYMLGVSLVGENVYHGKPTADALERLRKLTRDALAEVELSWGRDQVDGEIAPANARASTAKP